MTFTDFKLALNEYRSDLEVRRINDKHKSIQVIFPDGEIVSFEASYAKILSKLGISVAFEREINRLLDDLNVIDPNESKELYKYTKDKLKSLMSACVIIK